MSEKKFGAFEGVFTPTFLSILGIIMYLRLGWVVGSVGLGSALIIILISNMITIFTCLSVSSIATNMRIGAGGAYAIISRSLGLEIGGAIGIPLYISQAVSVAFYITGFSECWVSIFPTHPFIFVSLATWLALLVISYTSARLAFRLQYAIIVVVLLSLVSFFLGKGQSTGVHLFRNGMGTVGFWAAFAIFFPAVTGILAGLSMSGEIKKPERDIPAGILSAVGITFVIYLLLAFRFSAVATSEALAGNTSIILELGRWRSLIVAGIMGATLSSALSMFVASPRTLLALGKYRAIPYSSYFSHVNTKNEPSTAILFTALLALATILVGTLDKIAVLLTMFFLITYGMLNLSVFIEKLIGIPSFRPQFKISWIFPLVGGAGCLIAMFLINPVFSAVAVIVIAAIYVMLIRGQLQRDWPDVRKGFFIYAAEQSLKIASNLPYHPKIWKPNLLIPVGEPKNWTGILDLLKAIVYPSGRISFFTVSKEVSPPPETEKKDVQTAADMPKAEDDFSSLNKLLQENGILVTSHVIQGADFIESAVIVSQTLKSSILPPNVLFIKLGLTPEKDKELMKLVERVQFLDLGLLIFVLHPKIGLGQKRTINLWIREGTPNIDLAILIALQLEKNWEAKVRLLQVTDREIERHRSHDYLTRLRKMTRIPKDAEISVQVGAFNDVIAAAPAADINIFGMPENLDMEEKRRIAEKINTSVLFLRDSRHENVFV
ncbi:MAG: amino acid permease [Candidatus Omnitrophota bacterium]